MRKTASIIALLTAGAWPTVLMAAEQFEAHHPFLYLSAPLTGASKPTQPFVELGFAIRQSSSQASGYSLSSWQLPLFKFAVTDQGLRSWSAFGVDMTKLRANDDSSEGSESPSALGRVVFIGGMALLLTAAIVKADCAARVSAESTRVWFCP